MRKAAAVIFLAVVLSLMLSCAAQFVSLSNHPNINNVAGAE